MQTRILQVRLTFENPKSWFYIFICFSENFKVAQRRQRNSTESYGSADIFSSSQYKSDFMSVDAHSFTYKLELYLFTSHCVYQIVQGSKWMTVLGKRGRIMNVHILEIQPLLVVLRYEAFKNGMSVSHKSARILQSILPNAVLRFV